MSFTSALNRAQFHDFLSGYVFCAQKTVGSANYIGMVAFDGTWVIKKDETETTGKMTYAMGASNFKANYAIAETLTYSWPNGETP